VTPRQLVLRGLRYYWRTNLAVVAGVATAVAVLAGALLVGDSVRGSLRDLVLQRLGRADHAIISTGFFRELLAADLQSNSTFGSVFSDIAPLVIVQGFVTEQESGRRAGQVLVYGVDDRFWELHGVGGIAGPDERQAFVSRALAAQIGAGAGSALLVRVQRPSDVPLESIQGRKDDLGRTMRLEVRDVLGPERMGEFSLDPQQGDVRAVFVSLQALQQEIEILSLVNALLVSARPEHATTAGAELASLVRGGGEVDDVGLRVRALDRGAIVLESQTGLLSDEQVRVAQAALAKTGPSPTQLSGRPVFTYLANALRLGGREVPYSLVTAMDLRAIAPGLTTIGGASPSIVLTDWAARELDARVGNALAMEYYVWQEPGQLVTYMAEFRVAAIVPISASDRDLAPQLPGISDSPTLTNWDPPFPIDLRRIRPVDEAFWEQYRTTPKAFIDLDVGRRLWGSRYGSVTSVRIPIPVIDPPTEARERYIERLRSTIDPLAMGLAIRNIRSDGLAASRGATDFGAYFFYFSFFLVVSALLLAVLFFKLGIEQRAREVGLLRAVGFNPAAVRRLFMSEGLVLAVVGSALGVLGAVGYGWLMMLGLRTWWVDAVGTDALTLHVSPASLGAGIVGGIAAAMMCIWWTLRSLNVISERALLMGEIAEGADVRRAGPVLRTRRLVAAGVLTLLGVALIVLAVAGLAEQTGAFFGAGAALLIASLCLFSAMLHRRPPNVLAGRGWQPVSRLGLRNATYRPGRSVLAVAVIASATFILISVDAFRRDESVTTTDPRSGTGGYPLLVETLLPVIEDPNTRAGRDALGLFDLENVTFQPFRVLPGDDASCLNLYEVRNPTIIAPRDSFLSQGRFVFQDSLSPTGDEAENPWLLLQRTEADGAIPVIADANSMMYVLHRALGEDLVILRGDREIRLRLVAALRDSIFQSALIMSQANFLELFPEQAG
jgi:hypothetical protein